jgi:uncharacterized protein YceH (UPF0502 family)
MDLTLNPEESRVLGALIEKDMATPDYYPMSLNALVNACNQKTNRDPIVEYDEDVVLGALQSLRSRALATVLTGGSNRVPKYGHRASETLDLNNREMAVITVLLLRGPQTLNEIKTRTESLYRFDDSDSVETVLRRLAERAMAVLLPKPPGGREPRWAQLLSGEPTMTEPVAENVTARASLADRVTALETEVLELKTQIADLRKLFE